MNPDARDPLDELLRTRCTLTPPPDFTPTVLGRLQLPPILPTRPTFLSEYGVQTGLGGAALGLASIADPAAITAAIGSALHLPGVQSAAAIVAICLGWVLTRQGPEAEAV